MDMKDLEKLIEETQKVAYEIGAGRLLRYLNNAHIITPEQGFLLFAQIPEIVKNAAPKQQ